VIQEMQGWLSLWARRGTYARPADEDSFDLPYLGGIWAEIAPMFDLALQEMNLQGNEAILDLGAGQGWAARRFAETGCKVYAVDIVADERYGLGRSWAIMQHAGVYYEPVLADGQALPFLESRFDIVFMCGTLHHFASFDRVLLQIHSVLKPGGRFIATAEPSISVFSRERDVQATLEETEKGITERRPKVFQYWWALRRPGFSDIRVDTFETYHASASQIRDWVTTLRQDLYRRAGPLCRMPVQMVCAVARSFPHRWTGWFILQLGGGPLLLKAVKPA
jgi:ubiquinone/menaquinone biosynthesis C-methylase UbiE